MRRMSVTELAALYTRVRGATDALTEPLAVEDFVVQSMPDASPAKWHLGHTTWFFETFVLEPAGRPPVDPRFAVLFNSYYNSVGEQHPRDRRGLVTRPTVGQVLDYRRAVDEAVLALVAAGDAPLDVVEIGLHHEEQHQELLLTDVKHLFFTNPLRPGYRERAPVAADAPPLAFHPFAGGLVEIGAGADGFAFDNERPRHRVWLEPFALASRLVTNAEYRAFVDDGGYDRPELWLSDGWRARTAAAWRAPLYWERDDRGWHEFTLAGTRPLDPHAPVCHVSYYEADAYAHWAGARLPREAEWELAAAAAPTDGNFVDDKLLHPAPARAGGIAQLYGDAWEWTQSPYAPYPGFAPWTGSLGEYNGKFMCNQLVLRGGSCATPARHVRASYRNFFPPETRWQFSGIRLAK
jgi:ergothioneine biosynthesis protein EgtB